MKRVTVLLFLFFLLSTATLFAQGHSEMIPISMAPESQGYAQVAYDPNLDEYLVVWEDQRNGTDNTDIYGQFVYADGTLKGENFPICMAENHQYWPHLDFDMMTNKYLIVFEDWRKGGEDGDIRGVFIDSNGDFVDAPTSDLDHTFGICTHEKNIYTCSVAFNYKESVFLVVWGDFRNVGDQSWTGADVYGQLVADDGTLLPPPDPADPVENFAIANRPEYEENVADVTYNEMTNEFFVVFGTSIGYVLGQRVTFEGELLEPTGTISSLNKQNSFTFLPAIQISEMFNNGPDCLQAKVTSRTEYTKSLCKRGKDSTEVQVIWKGVLETTVDNDIYGQRLLFSFQDDVWVMDYVDKGGVVTRGVSNFPISIQDGWVGMPDIAYGSTDDEYLVSWGDTRVGFVTDLYAQRLGLTEIDNMLLLDDDRVNVVTEFENIPIDTSDNFEGSILGIAHSKKQNQFLVAFVFNDASMGRGDDIYAHLFYGTEPSAVCQVVVQPDSAALRAGMTQEFTALAYDDQGAPVDVVLTWSADSGTIDENGLFTAGDTAGLFTVTATAPDGLVSGSAKVNVLPMPATITVTPPNITLEPGETQQFTATGKTAADQDVTLYPVWSAEGGTIDQTGFFTAGNDTGNFTITVKDQLCETTGTANVHIYIDTGVDGSNMGLPTEFALMQNYPNPFNPETVIEFNVKEPSRVQLQVFNIQGKLVQNLVDEFMSSGRYQVKFNAQHLASGMYFYKIRMNDYKAVKKMMLLE